MGDAPSASIEVIHTPTRSPTKGRSLSDLAPNLSLSPSPQFREPARTTRDDISITRPVANPRRPNFPVRGLSLQVPPRETGSPPLPNIIKRAPLSPKLDQSTSYGFPSSVLPRRSRGLDFSRACTNLHHSTLAEQPSPDLSPTLSGRGMAIPPRRGLAETSNILESPGSNPTSLWSTIAMDRSGMASSVGSVNMLESDSSSSSGTHDELMDPDDGGDPMITTPQVYKLGNPSAGIQSTSLYAATGVNSSPGGDWMGRYSPAAASLMSFQRARLRKGRSRKSSSSASASGNSSMVSPAPGSPPAIKSIETAGSYSINEASHRTGPSRRSSLSWGTRDLHISSGGESDESGANGVGSANDGNDLVPPVTPGNEEKRGVIRRAVTRRGNLLPKTKNFARIRAALMEEGAPVDTEVKREAEVVRQVREGETDVDLAIHGETADSSPTMLPTNPGGTDLEDIPEDELLAARNSVELPERGLPFTLQAKRNSAGKEFWDSFDGFARTPPPPFFARASSSAISEDASMESPTMASSLSSSLPSFGLQIQAMQIPSRSSTPQPTGQPSAAEISRKVNGKRRRDDDLDAASFKRRAVSPGMSVQNSPILSQSPAQKDGGWWGPAAAARPGRDAAAGASGNGHGQGYGHPAGERANSGSSSSGGTGGGGTSSRRIGLQGMSDTNDGLMKMSIE
ncbi:MAG: hypothetical protein M1832_006151 [Thelocarpon impressellum]|nr:MAG: hypothetical protein M1832_006151 [Thelocarpon impressellum]